MRGRLARSLSVLATAAVALAVGPPAGAAAHPLQDPVPIEANQFFKGLVNGHPPGAAVIRVACVVGAATGHPLAGQPVEVEPANPVSTADTGYTGSKGKRITAALANAAAATIVASFTSYFVPQNIPTSLTVPCSGTGKMRFVPSPTSPTARAATLAVTFGNVAAAGR